MIKRDEISTPTSCLNKAADDEPIFVLRAHDPIAATIVRQWARDAAGFHEAEKREEARRLADKMDEWFRTSTR